MDELILKPKFIRVIIPNLFYLLISGLVSFLLILGLIFMKNELELLYFMGIALLILGSLFIYLIYDLGIIKSMKYYVKEKSIRQSYFFFTKGKKIIPFSEITDIGFNKTWFLDKIFGTGSLQISTSGSAGHDLIIKYIYEPDKTYDLLNSKLNLSKSIELNENGIETDDSQATIKLEERIQPSAGIATFITTIFGLIIWLVYFGIVFGFVVGIIQSIITYIAFKRKYFDFYTDKVEYYDGFFNKNRKTLAFNRITNIIENRSLIDRIFGVSKIFIETAGSAAPEIKITFVKNGEDIVNNLKTLLKQNGKN